MSVPQRTKGDQRTKELVFASVWYRWSAAVTQVCIKGSGVARLILWECCSGAHETQGASTVTLDPSYWVCIPIPAEQHLHTLDP